MSFVAAATIGGALIGSRSANKATQAQQASANDATALQREQFDATSERNKPFVEGGTAAFNALLSRLGVAGDASAPGYGTFGQVPTAEQVMQEPGYQFGLSEGQKALQNALNAKGMSYSGAALKAATRYGNDYASGQYNNAFNRSQSAQQQAFNQLGNVANMGQNSANMTGAAGANFATQAGNNMIGAGNASAANSLAQGNIWGNALNQGVSIYNRSQQNNGGGAFRSDDPYRQPWWVGGEEGE